MPDMDGFRDTAFLCLLMNSIFGLVKTKLTFSNCINYWKSLINTYGKHVIRIATDVSKTWCVWDTGEDSCSRYNYYPNAWAFDYPPTREKLMKMSRQELIDNCNEVKFDTLTPLVIPMESMDIMSYSYSGRHVLALI